MKILLGFFLFLLTCQPKVVIEDNVLTKNEADVIVNEKEVVIYKDSLYKVIGVGDGDTYDILVNKTKVRIRMNAIDAPERGMPYYQVSKKHLYALIFNKMVNVEVIEKDRHGRIIANTYLDTLDISAEMLKNGMAWHYKKYNQTKLYSQLEIDAKKNKFGLWQDKNPIAPWEIRKIRRSGRSTKDLFD